MQEPLAAVAAVAASPVFTVPLPVLVVNDKTGAQHCGTLQLPRLATPAPVPPSAAVLAPGPAAARARGRARRADWGPGPGAAEPHVRGADGGAAGGGGDACAPPPSASAPQSGE